MRESKYWRRNWRLDCEGMTIKITMLIIEQSNCYRCCIGIRRIITALLGMLFMAKMRPKEKDCRICSTK